MSRWQFILLVASLFMRRSSCFTARPSHTAELRRPWHDLGSCNVPEHRPRHRGPGRGLPQAAERDIPEIDPADALADASMDQGGTFVAGVDTVLDGFYGSTQWIVAGAVGATLVTRTDVDTLVWVLGSLVNAVFAKVLKKVINQVRPDGAQLKDPGMPSSHAMSLFFLATYLVVSFQHQGVASVSFTQWPLDVAGTQALLATYAATASAWRVKAGLHTLAQVSVGAVLGILDGILWHEFCQVQFISQVTTFFGGSKVPVEVSIGVCIITFLTFGNAQRRILALMQKARDTKDR